MGMAKSTGAGAIARSDTPNRSHSIFACMVDLHSRSRTQNAGSINCTKWYFFHLPSNAQMEGKLLTCRE